MITKTSRHKTTEALDIEIDKLSASRTSKALDSDVVKKIKDSGNRRQFDSGAVRDIESGKGRCDLLPLWSVSELPIGDVVVKDIFRNLDMFVWKGDTRYLANAIELFSIDTNMTVAAWMLDVSKHYEEGANKYGERNWEKGIPLHSFIDSAVRHLLKYIDGWGDEPHDRAFVWNLLGAIWTVHNKPDMIDLPFVSPK